MNTILPRIIFTAFIIKGVTLNLCAQAFAVVPKRHTIVVTQWNLPENKEDPPFVVEYNGELLHSNMLAMNQLNNLKFEVNSYVKVVLPTTPMPQNSFLGTATFLHHAIADGANLTFFRGDKQVDYHTLWMQNVRHGPTSGLKKWGGGVNTDTATYTLNGKKFFDGPSTVIELKKLSYEDKVVLVLVPPRDEVKIFSLENVDLSEIDSYIATLVEQGIRLIPVGGPAYSGWPVPIIK